MRTFCKKKEANENMLPGGFVCCLVFS